MQNEETTEVPQRLDPKEGTQAAKVLKVLIDADGDWVNYQHFVRNMYLTQAHYVIYELENRFGWKIEHSDFTDNLGFKSYRIVPERDVTRI